MSHTDGGRRRGRPPKSAGPATRERLLDAALALFARQGFHATTVREIGAAVGVRDSAIYAHFPGKQAVYDALMAEMGPLSYAALRTDAATVARQDPRTAVRALVDRVVETWTTPRAMLFAALLLREGGGESGTGGLAAAIGDAITGLEKPFRGWQRDGRMRADVPARQLVWELFAPLHIARVLYLRGDAADADPAAARRVIDAHVAFFLTCVIPSDEGER